MREARSVIYFGVDECLAAHWRFPPLRNRWLGIYIYIYLYIFSNSSVNNIELTLPSDFALPLFFGKGGFFGGKWQFVIRSNCRISRQTRKDHSKGNVAFSSNEENTKNTKCWIFYIYFSDVYVCSTFSHSIDCETDWNLPIVLIFKTFWLRHGLRSAVNNFSSVSGSFGKDGLVVILLISFFYCQRVYTMAPRKRSTPVDLVLYPSVAMTIIKFDFISPSKFRKLSEKAILFYLGKVLWRQLSIDIYLEKKRTTEK